MGSLNLRVFTHQENPHVGFSLDALPGNVAIRHLAPEVVVAVWKGLSRDNITRVCTTRKTILIPRCL
jgi:hypothetical protein